MIQTNWYVITGQPCSGKTTVIDRLRQMGYQVSEEVARQYYINLLKIKKREDILKDILSLQNEILNIELNREKKINSDDLMFFDRALPDSIAYYKNLGVMPDFLIKAVKLFRYRCVFFLEPLHFVKDAVRQEDGEVAKRLGQYTYDAYKNLGYDIISIPAVSVEERIDLILSHCAIKGECA